MDIDFSLFPHMDCLRTEPSHYALCVEFFGSCKMADDGGMRKIWTGAHHGIEFTMGLGRFTPCRPLPAARISLEQSKP